MTKSEQFAQAIKAAFAAAEPRRALYWRFCREYTAKSAEVGSVEELANQFAASLFAAEATNIEAQAVCACYIAYTDIYTMETRERSSRLQPIRDAIRAAGYSTEYEPTTIVHKAGKRSVCASFTVGPFGHSSDWRNRLLSGDDLRDELKRLQKEASGKTPAEIISDAEAAAAAWQMLKKQRDDYQNNIRGLRHMLQAISFDNWADSWRVTAF